MTKKEIQKEVDRVIDNYKKLDGLFESMHGLGLIDINGEFFNCIYGIFDDYLKVVQEKIEDPADWLNWYVYENKCGEGDLKAKASEKSRFRKIKTTEDLVELIVKKGEK